MASLQKTPRQTQSQPCELRVSLAKLRVLHLILGVKRSTRSLARLTLSSHGCVWVCRGVFCNDAICSLSTNRSDRPPDSYGIIFRHFREKNPSCHSPQPLLYALPIHQVF